MEGNNDRIVYEYFREHHKGKNIVYETRMFESRSRRIWKDEFEKNQKKLGQIRDH